MELNSLSIGYKAGSRVITIASGLTGEFHHGELTSVLGCNGCGKSTLLKTLAGFLPPVSGEILIDGKPLQSYDTQHRARLISIVTTEAPKVQGMSVKELVAMGRSPYTGFWGRLSKEDGRIISESLQTVGMTDYAQRKVTTLSDGERQKVMIAKAIAQQTPVIILDEPTSFLDYPSKVRTISLLQQLAHDLGKTIILTTHDLEQAIRFSDRSWMMDREKGLIIGTPDELKSQNRFKEYFGM